MEPKNVTIALTVDAWNLVLHALGQRPFVEVKGLIEEITKQANVQIGDPTDVPAPDAPVSKQLHKKVVDENK